VAVLTSFTPCTLRVIAPFTLVYFTSAALSGFIVNETSVWATDVTSTRIYLGMFDTVGADSLTFWRFFASGAECWTFRAFFGISSEICAYRAGWLAFAYLISLALSPSKFELEVLGARGTVIFVSVFSTS